MKINKILSTLVILLEAELYLFLNGAFAIYGLRLLTASKSVSKTIYFKNIINLIMPGSHGKIVVSIFDRSCLSINLRMPQLS